MRITFHIGTYTITIVVPSLDKGRHGFDGQKCAHTASSPLTIRQVWTHFCSDKTAPHLPAMYFRVIFGF